MPAMTSTLPPCSPVPATRPIHRRCTPFIYRARSARPPSATASPDVIVVGGGVAGLAAARTLTQAGLAVQLHEAADDVGGRVRTDTVDGFLLDRGFQIFLTSYPEAKTVLDYDNLNLQPFYAGASVRWNGDWYRVADPFRHPLDGVGSLTNPIGSPLDKVLVGLFRAKSLLGSLEDLMAEPETTTMERLKGEGFSQDIIDRFFRPFLGGIFFNRDLTVTSRLFRFVMRMLATGSNCLPAAGIGAVASQLAQQLPPGTVVTHSPAARVQAGTAGQPPSVTLADGRVLQPPRGVVVAVEGPAAGALVGDLLLDSPSKPLPGVGTCCLYFKAPRAPLPEPMLYLNGDGRGIINNMCFPSTVSTSYAPPNAALVSVSTLGTHPELDDAQLEAAVRNELRAWWGEEAATWEHLRTYRIPFAQPNQEPPTDLQRPVSLGGGVYVCGDHREAATLDGATGSTLTSQSMLVVFQRITYCTGALRSGRRAAEALLATPVLQPDMVKAA